MTPKITQHVASRNGKKNRVFTKSSRGAIDHTTAALMLGLAAVSIVGMLGFFYLQQVVHTASQSTDVRALESKITDLKEKQRVIELEGAKLRSLKNVEDDIEKLNLIPTDKVSYLAPSFDDHVALVIQ
ncbi:MAG TPA: hypothetical protein VJI96_01280 [Candidatus Andersenbacteria bacterium]|nr:hypothetical protein [Candidatus Andersenbacteria bacterium]